MKLIDRFLENEDFECRLLGFNGFYHPKRWYDMKLHCSYQIPYRITGAIIRAFRYKIGRWILP